MSESQTPRTDAELRRIESAEDQYEDRHDCYCALASFARQIESELTATRARFAKIEEAARADEADLNKMRDGTKLTRVGLVMVLQYLQEENKTLKSRLAELEGFTTWLFDNAEMLYWPGDHEYPVENKPLAKKNARMAMEMYFAKKFPAYKEGKK